MKKITAFFLLLLPIFVTGLMFVSGLIQNINFPVSVAGVSILESDQDKEWEKTEQLPQTTIKFSAHVLPLNAKNQQIHWTTSDDSIATVNDDGLVTIKDYGKFTVTATSVGNPSCYASRQVDSYDTVAHGASFSNGYDISYLSKGTMAKPNLVTKPSIDHVKHVKSIKYTLDESHTDPNITIDEDTGIISVGQNATAENFGVNVEVQTWNDVHKESDPQVASQHLDITIGEPIDTLSWKSDNTDLTISQNNYSLFDDVIYGPASDKITSKDFTFEVDDPEIASIENYVDEKTSTTPGKITFKQQDKYALFTITYKRNQLLKISKRIKWTNADLREIFWSQPQIEIPFMFNGSKNIPINEAEATFAATGVLHNEYILTTTHYPELPSSPIPNVTVTSTNPNVVDYDYNQGGGRLVMNNPGKCALCVAIKDGDDNIISSDVCEVNVLPYDTTAPVTSTNTPIIDSDNPLKTEWTYQFLREKIKCATDSVNPTSIRFEFEDPTEAEGKAYIDDNGIIHFTTLDATTLSVLAYIGDDTIGHKFNVQYQGHAQVEPTTIDPVEYTTITVGHPIKLNLAGSPVKPVIESKYYEKYFDVLDSDKGIFAANRGCDIPDFELEDGTKVHLVVAEDPIYISADQSPLYSTDQESVDFKNTIHPQVFPSSATKPNGGTYETTKIQYYCDDTVALVDQDVINFKKIGHVLAVATFDGIGEGKTWSSSYFVRTTWHDTIGKFIVTTNDYAIPSLNTLMKQYDKWNIDEHPTLRIKNVNVSKIDNINVTSETGLCQPTVTDAGILPRYIQINPNPITGKYGKDVIKISSPTYSLYLNVEISPTISDFAVTYKQDVWGAENIYTYTNNLKTVRITPNIADGTKEGQTWYYSFNSDLPLIPDAAHTKRGSQVIDLSSESWNLPTQAGDVEENTLYLYDQDKNPIKAYKIIAKHIDDAKASFYNSEDGIYSTCNSDTKSALIVADGYVDDSFYTAFKTNSTITKDGTTTKASDLFKGNNIVTIKGIPDPENDFNWSFKLSNGNTAKDKVYKIGRDEVSDIKLPRHNILDQSDRKGMQKVHVYGNKSYYNINTISTPGDTIPEEPGYGMEGEVNYYKVPVILYNSSRKKIESGDKKFKILNNLKIKIGRNSAAIVDKEDKGDFIRVYFDKNDLYSDKEIYNNAFDTLNGKNIDFSVSTKSNEVHADYRFVAVEGTNAWTEKEFDLNNDRFFKQPWNEVGIVLQKNFGVTTTKDKDNAPFSPHHDIRQIGRLHGNGYLLDLKNPAKTHIYEYHDEYHPTIWSCFNININGADNETLKARVHKNYIDLRNEEKYDGDRYYAYVSTHNFTTGFDMDGLKGSVYFKNSVLYNFIDSCFYLNGFDCSVTQKPTLYVEDCAFINSSFPILALGGAPMHFKGNIKLYNFQDKEMLRHVGGEVDITSLWPVLIGFARSAHMLHIDYKGEYVVNSFMVSALDPETYFWDYAKSEWVKSVRGISGSGKYLAKYADVSIPFPVIGRLGADLWGGTNPSYEKEAPSYEDEFDSNGKLKISLISEQINKFSRKPTYF